MSTFRNPEDVRGYAQFTKISVNDGVTSVADRTGIPTDYQKEVIMIESLSITNASDDEMKVQLFWNGTSVTNDVFAIYHLDPHETLQAICKEAPVFLGNHVSGNNTTDQIYATSLNVSESSNTGSNATELMHFVATGLRMVNEV